MRLCSAVAAALGGGLLFLGCGASNPPVAVVNGEALTQADLTDALLDRVGRQMLQTMIDETLIRQAAAKAAIEITDSEVEERINELRARYPSEEDFKRMVANDEQAMENLRRSRELDLMLDKLAAKQVKVTDAQCRQHFQENRDQYREPEQVQLRDMEFASKDNAVQVHKVLTDPEAGADFAALAKQFSTDETTKDKGGDMGLMRSDSLQPALKAAADKLQPGEISGVFENVGLWYILKLEKRIPERARTFDECRQEIEQLLTRQQQMQLKAGLVTKLREQAKIEIKDARLAPPSAPPAADGK